MDALSTEAPPVRRATNATKLYYGCGAVAFGIKDNGFSYFLMLFYNQVVGLPASMVGTALLIALLTDACLDPVIGHVSDNWRSRLGRRHPFMYLSAIPAAVAFAILWNPSLDWPQETLFVFLIVTTVVVRIFISLYEIPSQALAAELSEDYDERTSLFSFRSLFGWAGGLGVALIAYGLLLRPDAAHPVGQLNPVGYAHYGVMSGILMLMAILISAAGTHKHIPYLKAPPDRARQGLSATLREIAVTLSNQSFLMLLLAGLCTSMALGLQGGLQIYFNTYLWNLSSDQIAVLVLAVFPAAALGSLLAPHLSRRFDKKRSAIVLLFVSVGTAAAPLLLRLVDLFPANASSSLLPALAAAMCVSMAAIIAALVMIASMMADIVEDSALKTGRRSEGLFFATNFFMQKCVSGIGLFSLGLLLSLSGFPQNAQPGAVPSAVLANLVVIFVALHVLLFSLAAAFLSRYRITRETHEANLARLAG